MPSRELIADCVETCINAHGFDGMICIPNCDKIVPGMLMGAVRVDIPTVSRWLGHKDGGALAMKTYGHLRREHSIAQAQRVTFTSAPSKQADIIAFPAANA